jgi:hypothetical protein
VSPTTSLLPSTALPHAEVRAPDRRTRGEPDPRLTLEPGLVEAEEFRLEPHLTRAMTIRPSTSLNHPSFPMTFR